MRWARWRPRTGVANLRFARALKGNPESTVIGGGLRVDRTKAAFVNSQLANLLDFDDTFDVYPPGHLGCLIVPAALAVGEACGSSGRDVVTAAVAGYELTLRLGCALGSILWSVGGAGASIASLIGPMAAASSLEKLDRETTQNALCVLTLESGLGMSAPTRRKWDVPPQMELGNLKGNFGQAAELGILAALKARRTGLTGMAGLLDADRTGWYSTGNHSRASTSLSRGSASGLGSWT